MVVWRRYVTKIYARDEPASVQTLNYNVCKNTHTLFVSHRPFLFQMAFVVVLLQELITGKGVIQGFQEGDVINLAFLGFAVVSTLGLTAFLAAKGSDEFVD